MSASDVADHTLWVLAGGMLWILNVETRGRCEASEDQPFQPQAFFVCPNGTVW
jgi:hypothetical protein